MKVVVRFTAEQERQSHLRREAKQKTEREPQQAAGGE